ncbi:MAG: YaaR family protein [Spirochaeta sp.]
MERIEIQPGAYFPLSHHTAKGKTEDKKRAQKKSGVFRSLFEADTAGETASASRLPNGPIQQQEAEELFQSIQSAGEQLKRFPGKENTAIYTALVKELVAKVVRDGIVVEDHSSGSHVLKRKNFSLVRIVDEKLAQLADGLAVTQREQIEMLARVDEIQGLLVDLLH